MNRISFFVVLILSFNANAADYYNSFYSDYHNTSKVFTDNDKMHEENFTDIHEVNLPWINALVRIPLGDGGIFRGSMKDLKGSENFLNGKFKTIIYLHGCAGHWVGTAKRIDFYAKNGYAVIAPPSMARNKYAQSCDTAIPRGGMYRSVLKIRQIDAENAIVKAKQLSWTDNENIFLVGLSEGGITTATFSPKNKESSIKGRVIEGWTCNAGWREYAGLNTPYNEPVLSLVAKYDPWFQEDYLRGHCGQYINDNPLSQSIIVDDDTQLSKAHGLMHDNKIQKITLEFLKKVSK
tara:strand:- start:4285 stop:5163 length:879 start_codon:yes stop_codon:yes gene_type:complete